MSYFIGPLDSSYNGTAVAISEGVSFRTTEGTSATRFLGNPRNGLSSNLGLFISQNGGGYLLGLLIEQFCGRYLPVEQNTDDNQSVDKNQQSVTSLIPNQRFGTSFNSRELKLTAQCLLSRQND